MLCPEEDGDRSKAISVFDLDRISLSGIQGENLAFLRECTSTMGDHYPERAGKILVTNAPGFFALLWRMASPLIPEPTKKKITISRAADTTNARGLLPPECAARSVPPLLSLRNPHHIRQLQPMSPVASFTPHPFD